MSSENSPVSEFNVRDYFNEIIDFLSHPVSKIHHLPPWTFKKSILTQVIFSLISGVFAGIIGWNFYFILYGLFLFPVIAVTAVFILTLFFYYYVQAFERRVISFHALLTLCVLANIPFLLFNILYRILPIISLVGSAMTGLILVVGLNTNFHIQKRRAFRLVIILYLVLAAMWIYKQIELMNLSKSF